MKNKFVCVVGSGYWGKNHVKCYQQLGVLHTICDQNSALLAEFKSQYGNDLNYAENFASVLTDRTITNVVIATPAVTHYELTKKALLAGKHVLVEKPLALSTQEADELIALAHKEKRTLMVGHILQFHPIFQRVKSLVANKAIGDVKFISSHRLNMGLIRHEENALWSLAPHDLSLILALLPYQQLTELTAHGVDYLRPGHYDDVRVNLKFGAAQAYVRVSWFNPFKEQKLVVVGTQGMIEFDDTKPWDEKLMVYRGYLSTQKNHRGEELANLKKVEGEKILVEQSEPLKNEALHFLNCSKSNIRPDTDGQEAYQVLSLLSAATESLNKKGAPIMLEQANVKQNPYSKCTIHPSAIVDEGAVIGDGTSIWHFTHISSNCKLGQECRIGQNVFIAPDVICGNNVKIQNNVSLYTGVICEDHVFLGPSMVFTNITNPRCEVNRRSQYEKTYIRKGATIGANATIVCGHELGEYCFIGAGTTVTKNVKPYALMVGNPARQIGWMGRYGHRLDLPLSTPENQPLYATCKESGQKYCLRGDRIEFLGENN